MSRVVVSPDEAWSNCPYCGQPAASVQEEVAHMQEAHPDIIRERLGAAADLAPEYMPGTTSDYRDDSPPPDVTDADWQAMCRRAHHAEARVVALTVRAQNAEEERDKLRVSVAKLRDQLAQNENTRNLGKSP